MLKKLSVCLFLLLALGVAQSVFALTDPTRPAKLPSADQLPGKDLDVTAIYFSRDHTRYVAMINGELYGAGDLVGNYRIVNIQPHAIKFRGAEGVFTRRLVSPRVKYPVHPIKKYPIKTKDRVNSQCK